MTEPRRGLMERLSDGLGSPHGIWMFNLAVVLYILAAGQFGFDHYPFNFLTLVLSVLAIQFTMVVLVVQNRQTQIDAKHAEQERADVAADLAWNEKAYDLIAEIHEHLVPTPTPALRATGPDKDAIEPDP